MGPFLPETVAEMVRVGTLGADATVWHEGLPDWIPVGTFLQQQPQAAVTTGAGAVAQGKSDGAAEWGVTLKAVACGLLVALVAGAILGFVEAKLGYSNRGTRRILSWLVVGLGCLVGFTVSRVSRGYDSWLVVVGAAAAGLVGILFSGFVAGVVSEGSSPGVLTSIMQIVIGTVAAGWIAKTD